MRETGQSERWIYRSTTLGICPLQASSVMETGSLWNFSWGMGEGNCPCQCLCSLLNWALSSWAQQLSLLESSHRPCSLRAELLTFNIPDVKSCWLSELTQSGPSAFASQISGGSALPRGLPLHHPSSLLPVRVARTASPPFLPSSVGLLSMLGSRESVLLVFWQFSGLFRQMWVESKRSAARGKPSVLPHSHLPLWKQLHNRHVSFAREIQEK